MTQRDVMGREVGGGFMFGSACTPVVVSCQCMAKPIQYCKVKYSKNKNFLKMRKKKKKSVSVNTLDLALCFCLGMSSQKMEQDT